MSEEPFVPDPARNPPPLVVAASLVAVQGVVLLLLSILEFADLTPGRSAMAVSTATFFAAYGVVLLGAAYGLVRRAAWSRGPALLSQLISLGLAWNVRDHWPVAVGLALVALISLAGMLHPDSIEAIEGSRDAERDQG